MSLKSWFREQQRRAAEDARRGPLWTGTTIVLFVYGINGIVGELASAVGRSGWDLHGGRLLIAALGAAIGGTVAVRRTRAAEATT
jgi:hypothetical protein